MIAQRSDGAMDQIETFVSIRSGKVRSAIQSIQHKSPPGRPQNAWAPQIAVIRQCSKTPGPRKAQPCATGLQILAGEKFGTLLPKLSLTCRTGVKFIPVGRDDQRIVRKTVVGENDEAQGPKVAVERD